MYEIKVISGFNAAHNLREYGGKCENLHGHNWKVELIISSENLNSTGMVMDFKDLKEILEKVLNDLDHKHLNELSYFKKVNPTSENIAEHIHTRVCAELLDKDQGGLVVRVWETENSCAGYFKIRNEGRGTRDEGR